MKLSLPLGIASVLLAAFGFSNARADSVNSLAGSGSDFFVITFNESLTATISNNGGPITTLTGTLAPDPAVPAGGGGNVLTFMLPSPVITGDVRIFEPPSLSVLSDVLRFTNAAGSLAGALNGDRMIVYSDANDVNPIPVPADVTPFPNLTPRDGGGIMEGPNPLTPNLPYTDENNGVLYQPGGPNNNNYVFTSDSTVPEPASIVTFGLGALGVGAYVWRRRQRTAS